MSTITAKVDWWADFFHGIVLDLWRAAITEEATAAQATFLEQTFGIRPGSSVLDVPCGNGRLALALAGKGYRLTGVDIASEFIDEARSHDDDIQWICGDMRVLPDDEPFDAAFCWPIPLIRAHADKRPLLKSSTVGALRATTTPAVM